jgi:hypothetical protein
MGKYAFSRKWRAGTPARPAWRDAMTSLAIATPFSIGMPNPPLTAQSDGINDYSAVVYVPTLGRHGAIVAPGAGGHAGNEIPAVVAYFIAEGVTLNLGDTPELSEMTQANGCEVVAPGNLPGAASTDGNRSTFFGAPGWPSVSKWSNGFPKEKFTFGASRGPTNPWPLAHHTYNAIEYIEPGDLGTGAKGGIFVAHLSSAGLVSGGYSFYSWVFDCATYTWRILDEIGPPSYYANLAGSWRPNGFPETELYRWIDSQPNSSNVGYCRFRRRLYTQGQHSSSRRAIASLDASVANGVWQVFPCGTDRIVQGNGATVASNESRTFWVEVAGTTVHYADLTNATPGAPITWATATLSGAALPAQTRQGCVKWERSIGRIVVYNSNLAATGWPANTIALITPNFASPGSPWPVQLIVGTGGSFRTPSNVTVGSDQGHYRRLVYAAPLGCFLNVCDFQGAAQALAYP